MMNERSIDQIHADMLASISEVERSGASNELLYSLDRDFRELFELIKLFLISERDAYYGYFLMNMSVVTEFDKSFIAGIKLNEDPPVFTCNPLFLCKMSLQEIIYVICHEIEHVLLDHPAQAVLTCKDEPEQTYYEFNLAADASVNDRLDAEIVEMKECFMSPPEGVINSETLRKILKLKHIKHLENYAYYFGLVHRDKPGNETPNLTEISSKQAESIADSLSKQSESGQGQEEISNAGADQPEIAHSQSHQKMEDHQWGIDDPEEAHAAAKNFVNAAYESMDDETRGMVSGSFISTVERINRPPVLKWEQILKRYVGTIAAGKRKTKTRLNRRQPNRYDLSGSMSDKVLKIVVCLDTSASVSDQMIAHIINEVFAILAKRKKEITIIECDSEVQRVYVVHTPEELKAKVYGRGGTAFTPAIEYINNNKYYRDALMVYFTDGFGENKIPRPLIYRALWVVFGDKENLSLTNPYGDVVSMNVRDDNE